MMRSAVERASKPLKFWILGNFLSPAFRHSVRARSPPDGPWRPVTTSDDLW